jgi:hypothetical protein
MGDFLKITRNDQILDNALDRPEANSLDAPSIPNSGWWEG